MLHCIILGILTVGAKGGIVDKVKEEYNHTITEEELRDRIPEPSITLLKPRGFTVSIPDPGRIYIIRVQGIINKPVYDFLPHLHPTGFSARLEIYPKHGIWMCIVDKTDIKLGDIVYLRFVAVADNGIPIELENKALAQKLFIVSVGRNTKVMNASEVEGWECKKPRFVENYKVDLKPKDKVVSF